MRFTKNCRGGLMPILIVKPSTASVHLADEFNRRTRVVRRRLRIFEDDPSDAAVHDLRVAIRRLDSTSKLLPKRDRRRSTVAGYIEQCRKVLGLTSKIRDCDILVEHLSRYNNPSVLGPMVKRIRTKREDQLRRTKRYCSSLIDARPPQIAKESLRPVKVQSRFQKVTSQLMQRIWRNIPVAVSAPTQVDLLHKVRKDCKRLRYMLEILPRDEHLSKQVGVLQEWQDALGSIRDRDVVIGFLKREDSSRVNDVLKPESVERAREFEALRTLYSRRLASLEELKLLLVPRSTGE
jgi:CHAD domain-containing protein